MSWLIRLFNHFAPRLKSQHTMSSSDDKLKPIVDPNQAAAQQFLTELRTRISTQPLPYQYGVESRALTSMWEVFVQAREAIKKNPGCEKFADRTTEVLNLVVRPLTAKWDRALEDGRLNGRDGADEFRGELEVVQKKLRRFATELHEAAYGTTHKDALTPPVMQDRDIDALFEPLPFGFTPHIPDLPAVADAIAKHESDAAGIAKDEHGAVASRREKKKIETPAGLNAIGLALSGGGIRSATFSLGVVQVLAEKGFLEEVDFLSTVSGGGYTGSFLTQRLGNGETQFTVGAPRGPDPEPVRYVRQRAKFLSPSNLKEKWSMVTATLTGMLLNWTAPLLVILVLALAAIKADPFFKEAWPIDFYISAGVSAAAMVVYGIGMRLGAQASLIAGRVLGLLLAVTGFIGAGWMLDYGYSNFSATIGKPWGTTASIGAVLASVAAAVPTMIRYLPVLKNPKIRQIVLKVALLFAGLLVPLGGLLLFYVFRGIGAATYSIKLPQWIASVPQNQVDYSGFVMLACVAAAFALISFFLLNINLTGPHRLYRDCLARTFIQTRADGVPKVKLVDINPQGTAPYHIINAALNVPSSQSFALKDRGCDFFMFSKKWIGSTAAGYHPTTHWKANGAPVDLATAMAVSGAAFSSYMGLGSLPTLTALLTFLNVRLGFWIKKPVAGRFAVPGFSCLLREMIGIGMSENAKWLNLSDGGHIENMAVYELLRRRCKFIICVDGESDPTFTFQGLMTLVRHAQIDFGVHIDAKLDDIRPDPKSGYSKSHFHFCRIHYPEGVGLLLYIKLSVTGNESELIRRYRINNPDFPHQTTLDQFFDQEQFEAYRQLGVHAAEGLFMPALMSGMRPASVREWFEQLSRNLLEPIRTSRAL